MRPDRILDYYGKWFSASRTGGGLVDVGHSGPHVANIICALQELRYRPSTGEVFSPLVAAEVKRFQEDTHHKNKDGRVGRGTRRLLVDQLLERSGPAYFRREFQPTFPSFFRVFLSYAWADRERVNRLDQWLRDHGLSVARDIHDFEAGKDLREEIADYLHTSDKVVVVVTPASQAREWPTFERFVAVEIEELRKEKCLIYLLLDGTNAPKYDSTRINISGAALSLREIGEAIRRSVEGPRGAPPRYEYDDSQAL